MPLWEHSHCAFHSTFPSIVSLDFHRTGSGEGEDRGIDGGQGEDGGRMKGGREEEEKKRWREEGGKDGGRVEERKDGGRMEEGGRDERSLGGKAGIVCQYDSQEN